MNTLSEVVQAVTGTISAMSAPGVRRLVLVVGAQMSLTTNDVTQQFAAAASATAMKNLVPEVSKSSDQSSQKAAEITIQQIELG